ncbi:MAG TPA: hypothetical protein VF162_05885 [Streptosporangiaceae bacterium]
MPIDLVDIPAAVSDYLGSQVTTTVSPVIPKPGQGVLTPGQAGTFTVTATNAGSPDGVRLINVAFHVKISDDTVAQLIVPDSAIVSSYATLASVTPLTPGSSHPAMFLRTHAGTTLDVGDIQPPIHIDVHCLDKGDAKITCHIHADIDESDLFPNSQNPNGEQTITVLCSPATPASRREEIR